MKHFTIGQRVKIVNTGISLFDGVTGYISYVSKGIYSRGYKVTTDEQFHEQLKKGHFTTILYVFESNLQLLKNYFILDVE